MIRPDRYIFGVYSYADGPSGSGAELAAGSFKDAARAAAAAISSGLRVAAFTQRDDAATQRSKF